MNNIIDMLAAPLGELMPLLLQTPTWVVVLLIIVLSFLMRSSISYRVERVIHEGEEK